MQTLLWIILVMMSIGVTVATKVLFRLKRIEDHLEAIAAITRQIRAA